MTKLNLLLVMVLIVCALGVVTSQHKARKLFVELEQEQSLAKQMDVEWGQLQLEQSTWAMHSRIEKIAGTYLQMRVPESSRIQVVPVDVPKQEGRP
ncbi:MAG: cell division protein FtsL [Pseudomonadota bacterium]|jgi:cell division protein FtsL